jgi:hypothetical protein
MISKRIMNALARGLTVVMLVLPAVALFAQSDPQVNAVDRYLSGRRFLVSYREGGAAYGSHILLDVHYCSNHRYILSGESRRQTVLDNWQVNRWEDSGQWAVMRVEGRVGVRGTSISGNVDFVAAEILPDGRLWVGDGVSVRHQGPAVCSLSGALR